MNLWPAPLYIFSYYLINGKIFEMLLNIKCVFQFSLQLLSEKFFILRGTAENIIKNVHCSSCKITFILSDLNEA